MFQDSSIEEMPALLDRVPDSVPNILPDADWLDPEIAALEHCLRNGDPDFERVQLFKKTNTPLRCLKAFRFDHVVRQIVIHPDGETLLTIDANRSSEATIQAWNWRTGNPLFSLKGHRAPITAVALSQTGETLVTGSHDRTIKLWNVATGEELRTLNGHHSPITAIAISADRQTVVSSGCNQYEIRDRQAHVTVGDRALRIWNREGETVHRLPCLIDVPTLAIRGGDLLKLESRSEVVNLETRETYCNLPREEWLAVTLDWQKSATIVGRQVMIREGITGEVSCRISLDLCDRAIQVSALSPDGKWFVAGFGRTEIHRKHSSYVRRQNVLRIWDAETGELLGSLFEAELGAGMWQAIEFSQSGEWLVTSVGNRLNVWNCDR